MSLSLWLPHPGPLSQGSQDGDPAALPPVNVLQVLPLVFGHRFTQYLYVYGLDEGDRHTDRARTACTQHGDVSKEDGQQTQWGRCEGLV